MADDVGVRNSLLGVTSRFDTVSCTPCKSSLNVKLELNQKHSDTGFQLRSYINYYTSETFYSQLALRLFGK